MKNHFDVCIDRYWNTATVKLNDIQVSQYSPLARCAISPIETWIQDLPTMLHREVNSEYTLHIFCHPYLCHFLKSLFGKEPMCKAIDTYAEKQTFNTASRLFWAQEAASALKCSLPKRIPITITAENALQATLHNSLPISKIDPSLFSFTDGKCGSVHIIQSIKELRPYTQANPKEVAYCFVDDDIYVNMQQCMPVVFGRIEDFSKFLADYYDYIFDRPYLLAVYTNLLSCCNKQNVPFLTRAKVEMLMKDTPSVSFSIDKRVEVGDIVNYKIISFPEESLRIESTIPGIVSGRGKDIVALAEGKTKLRLYDERHNLLEEEEIEVYCVNRVKDIVLSTQNPNSTFLQGEIVHINFSFIPNNAENIYCAKWSISDTNILSPVGAGNFKAIGFGSCRITLSIEKVSASIDVSILPQATDIQIPANIALKVNEQPFQVKGYLIPSGAACKRIECKVLDTTIAGWDSCNNSIYPISEGTTKLEITLIKADGKAIQHRYCDISILPSKPVITPEPSMAFLWLCAFFVLLTIGKTVFPFALSALGGCSVWHLLHIFKSSSFKQVWNFRKMDLLVAVIAIVVTVVSLRVYYS